MTMQLTIQLAGEPEDFGFLAAGGNLEREIVDICVNALLNAGYEIYAPDQPTEPINHETWPWAKDELEWEDSDGS